MGGPRKRLIDPRHGQRLAQLRRYRGMTQQQLAVDIGVSTRTLQEWELGYTAMRLDLAAQVARVLDVRFVCEFVLEEISLVEAAPCPNERISTTTN